MHQRQYNLIPKENEANLRQLQERIRSEEKKSLQSDNINSLDDFGGAEEEDEVVMDTSGRRPPGAKSGKENGRCENTLCA